MNIEEFVNDYLQEHRHDVLLNPYNGLVDFANAFKEKMMKDAVDVQVVGEQRDLRLIDSTQRCLFNAKRGDWLEIIICKKED